MDSENATVPAGSEEKATRPDPAALLTPDEVAVSCRVAVSTVYGWLNAKKLKGKKLGGGVWRVTRRALAEFKGEVDLFGGNDGRSPDQ